MDPINLNSQQLTWIDLQPAGAEQYTRMSTLWAESEKGLRTVLIDFPAGWRRDAVGHQPAQEELLVVSGFVEVSGLKATEGQLLLGVPYATRAATVTPESTRVLAWFTGEAGGWREGPAEPPREMEVLDLQPGMVRPAKDGLRGSVQVLTELQGESFDAEADLYWPGENIWMHLPSGARAPQKKGSVVVKFWD